MNKAIVAFVLVSVLLFGLTVVSAEAIGNANTANVDQGESLQAGELQQIQAGETYMAQNGESIQVQGEGNRTRLRVRDVEAHTDLEVTSDGQKFRAKLSNGRNAEIKIMPNVASERALERLRLRNCTESQNCTIELREVGQGNQSRLAYEVQAERHARILGLFQAKMQVQAQVDAETGELIRVGKPWWAFLATESEE